MTDQHYDPDIVPERPEDEGRKGGAAEAHAGAVPAYYDRAAAAATEVTPLGWIRWGSTIAGLVIALATIAFLNAVGVGLGLRFNTNAAGGGLAYWLIASAAIGLFLGSFLAARFAKARTVGSAIMHGVVIWAIFMLLDISGFGLGTGFGLFYGTMATAVPLAPGAGPTSLLISLAWWFVIGYLVALIAAVLGGAAGVTQYEEEIHVPESRPV